MNLAGGLGIALFILGAMLALAVNEVRKGDRENARLEFSVELEKERDKWQLEKLTEIAAIDLKHDGEQSTIIKERDDALSKFNMLMVNASFEARNKPLIFGDDMLRDIIYYDCLFSLGKAANQREARSACGREADMAASTGQGVPVTIINQDFLGGWAAACDPDIGWGRVGGLIGDDEFVKGETEGSGEITYTRIMWEAEFPGFNPDMCRETVVAFTPEASIMFRRMFANADGYIAGMVGLAHTQDKIIDQISGAPSTDQFTE